MLFIPKLQRSSAMRTNSSNCWPSPPSWSPPTVTVDLVRDPDDNRLIEAAQAGGAEVIVTGDKDLLTRER